MLQDPSNLYLFLHIDQNETSVGRDYIKEFSSLKHCYYCEPDEKSALYTLMKLGVGLASDFQPSSNLHLQIWGLHCI